MRVIKQKGAMFGLDARIALVIFAALGMISGVALFSVVKSVQAEQWRQYFESIVKASEQRYLDTGSEEIAGAAGLVVRSLFTNYHSSPLWKGPYLSGAYFIGLTSFRDYMTERMNATSLMRIQIYRGTTWPLNDVYDANFPTLVKCSSGDKDCYEYAYLSYGGASASDMLELFNSLDELVDDSDGALNGKVRLLNDSSASNYNIVYQGKIYRL